MSSAGSARLQFLMILNPSEQRIYTASKIHKVNRIHKETDKSNDARRQTQHATSENDDPFIRRVPIAVANTLDQ
uniref:Uncharacterized protein n=1 Tax=Strongyloides papillosus TaxID=174720 RepID=A0A0N5BP39_STREA